MLVTLLLYLGAADFQSLDGKAAHPLTFARAKATAWFFVGSECPISNSYAPELNRLDKEFRDKGVSLYLVYSDPSEKRASALAHWKSFHLAMPGILDPRQELMKKAGASRTPEAAIFDSGGNLVYRGRIDDRWPKLGVARTKAQKRDVHDVLEAVLKGRKGRFAFTEAVGCYIPSP